MLRFTAVFNALADSRKNVICDECSGMSANQKNTESDKDRDSDDLDDDYDNFAPPPQSNPQQQSQSVNQQGRTFSFFCTFRETLILMGLVHILRVIQK